MTPSMPIEVCEIDRHRGGLSGMTGGAGRTRLMRIMARRPALRTVLPLAAVALLLVAGAAWGIRDVAYAGSRSPGHHRPTHHSSGSPTPSAIPPAPASRQASASASPAPTAPSTSATAPILQEQWAAASSPIFDFWPRAGSTVTSGSHDTGAVDGSALR